MGSADRSTTARPCPLATAFDFPSRPARGRAHAWREGNPNTGAIKEAETIKEADDLKEATAQKAAMTKAKVPLLNAAETAVNTNAGFRAVSIYPQLQNGNPMAEVTLLQGTTFKKVMEKLD